MTNTHHLPLGKAASEQYAVDVTPESAGWGYSSLRVLELPPGGTHHFTAGDSEWIVLSLSGGGTVAVTDDFGGETYELHGRDSVFSGPSDFVYVPRDATASLTSEAGGRFALTGARCTRSLPARYEPASSVPVELRDGVRAAVGEVLDVVVGVGVRVSQVVHLGEAQGVGQVHGLLRLDGDAVAVQILRHLVPAHVLRQRGGRQEQPEHGYLLPPR